MYKEILISLITNIHISFEMLDWKALEVFRDMNP